MGTGGLIFDMDGTMIDSMPFHGQSWVSFAQRHGIKIEEAVCTRHQAHELAGPHVLVSVQNYHELIASNFLETIHAYPQ